MFYNIIVALFISSLCFDSFAKQTVSNNNDQTIIILNTENEIKAYLDSIGEEYDSDILEIRKIVYSDSNVDSGISTAWGLDFEARNTKKRDFVDTNNLLAQFNRPAGKVTIEETFKASNKFEADAGITKSMLKIALGFSVTAESTLTVNWSSTYKYKVKIKIYPLYEVTEGELWEDDI